MPEGGRLELRPITQPLARRLLDGPPDESWADGYPAPGDREAAAALVIGKPMYERNAPFLTYQLVRRSDGRVVGGAGFHGPPDADGVVIVGYGVVPEEEGRGYGTEALLMLVDIARRNGVRRVRGDAELDNRASQRVMEKAGFHWRHDDGKLRYYERRLG